MKIVSIRPAKNLIASSVADRPRGDPYEGPARAFFTGRELSEAACKSASNLSGPSGHLQLSSPFWQPSCSSLRQHLTGQKGPNMGDFYALRVSRSVVVSLSLSRRDAAYDSEAACELRPAGCPLGIPYHYICTLGMKLRDMWAMMAWYLSFLLVG